MDLQSKLTDQENVAKSTELSLLTTRGKLPPPRDERDHVFVSATVGLSFRLNVDTYLTPNRQKSCFQDSIFTSLSISHELGQKLCPQDKTSLRRYAAAGSVFALIFDTHHAWTLSKIVSSGRLQETESSNSKLDDELNSLRRDKNLLVDHVSELQKKVDDRDGSILHLRQEVGHTLISGISDER